MGKPNKDKKDQKNKKISNYDDLDESLGTEIKKKIWDLGLIAMIVLLVFLCVYFQYRYEMKQRRSAISDENEIDYYEILGVEYGADLKEIRTKYKELAKIWHPDKNLDCKNCHEKFAQISKAYEVLSDAAKKDEYDTKGGKGNFKSSVILTVKNYHHLVEESNDFWVILVFENTRGNRFNQYILEVWEEVSSKYKHTVRFGVIDVLQGENILHFLPFKFQFYPNMFTYLHGQDSELLQNVDSFSVRTFTQFIENSFITKTNLVDNKFLQNMLQNINTERDVSDANVNYEDLDIKTFVLSSKNYIDLETKDFDKNYHHVISTFQNDFGYFNQALDIFKSKGNTRVFVTYNDIILKKEEGNNKIFLKKTLQPLPINFNMNTPAGPKLQKAFNFIKSMALQRIYRNNYSRHCTDKILIEGEEIQAKEQSHETKLNLCIIMLEHPNDLNEKNVNANFYKILIENFQRKLANDGKKKKAISEEYDINLNYGVTSLENNKEIKNLFVNYAEKKHFKYDDEKFKLLLIINDTHEKFAFKAFTDDENLHDFLSDLHNSDFYEDISFSVRNTLYHSYSLIILAIIM